MLAGGAALTWQISVGRFAGGVLQRLPGVGGAGQVETGPHVVRWRRRWPQPLRQPLQAHASLEGVHGGGDRNGRSRGRGWERPAAGAATCWGTRERRLSGCPPGLPAPTATPPALHRPLGAAGPGSGLGARPRAPAAPASAARPARAPVPIRGRFLRLGRSPQSLSENDSAHRQVPAVPAPGVVGGVGLGGRGQ